MSHHYLFWATGQDKPGIVAAVSKLLFQQGFNLEDSAMMRLENEFGIFLIFSSDKRLANDFAAKNLSSLEKKFGLNLGLKPMHGGRPVIKGKQAFMVTVHGLDRPGIVFYVTDILAKVHFNISDLTTHRTTSGAKPGYILFIEGELATPQAKNLQKKLAQLEKKLRTKIQLQPIPINAF